LIVEGVEDQNIAVPEKGKDIMGPREDGKKGQTLSREDQQETEETEVTHEYPQGTLVYSPGSSV